MTTERDQADQPTNNSATNPGVSESCEGYSPNVQTERREATLYRRARRELEAALADLTAHGKALAESRYQRTHRGTLIERARRMRAESIDVVTLAVISERMAGATWTEIADALALDERFVVEHYEPLERQWATGNGIGPVVRMREGQPPSLRLVGLDG